MEAIGIALGAMPLLLYAIDNYRRCLEPISRYRNYTNTLHEIRLNLLVQKRQLQVTLENISSQRNPTAEQVEQRLRELYPECYDEFVDLLSHMNEYLTHLMNQLDIDSSGKVCNSCVNTWCA